MTLLKTKLDSKCTSDHPQPPLSWLRGRYVAQLRSLASARMPVRRDEKPQSREVCRTCLVLMGPQPKRAPSGREGALAQPARC